MDPDKKANVVIRDWLRGDVPGQSYGGLTDPNSSERGSANWIYDDIPLSTLSSSSYPRVSIQQINRQKVSRGGRSTLSYDLVHLQIDIYCAKRDTNLQISGTSYDHQQICWILEQQIGEAIESYMTEDLFDYAGIYLPTDEEWQPTSIPARRDEDRDEEVWIKTFEIILRGFNVGK